MLAHPNIYLIYDLPACKRSKAAGTKLQDLQDTGQQQVIQEESSINRVQ